MFVEKKNRVFLRFIDDETEDAFSRVEQIGPCCGHCHHHAKTVLSGNAGESRRVR